MNKRQEKKVLNKLLNNKRFDRSKIKNLHAFLDRRMRRMMTRIYADYQTMQED